MAGAHLRGVVIDDLRALLQDQTGEIGGCDIQIDSSRPGIDVRPFAGGEIIDDDHLMSELDVGVDDMRGNEPGSTRYHDLHTAQPFRRFRLHGENGIVITV